MNCKWRIAGIGLLSLFFGLCLSPCRSASEEPENEPQVVLSKRQVVAIVQEALLFTIRAKDALRLVSVKLPTLSADNLKFRKLDRELDRAQEEVYPATNAAEKLKTAPQNLREAIRLYLSLMVVQERCLPLAGDLNSLEQPAATSLAVQVTDVANTAGRLSLRLHPYVYRLIDAYLSAAPPTKVQVNMQWMDEETQGPAL